MAILDGSISRLSSVDVVPRDCLRAVNIIGPIANADNLVEASERRTGDRHPTAKVVADVKDPTVERRVSVVAHRPILTAEGELPRNGS